MSYGEESIQSLARGLSVLRSFRPGSERLTQSEVANACQLTRAGARRILNTLQDLGYVALDGRHYFLTARVLDLGKSFLGHSLWKVATRELQTVVDELNETASAAVLEGFEIVYAVRILSPRPLHLEPHWGLAAPAHCSSVGRVLLSALPPNRLDRYLSQTDFPRYTRDTVCEPEDLRAHLNDVRAKGWSHVVGEVDEGVCCVAVPVKSRDGETIAALSVGSTRARANLDYVEHKIVPALQRAARAIEDRL